MTAASSPAVGDASGTSRAVVQVRSVLDDLRAKQRTLYGVICRDPTLIEIELLAGAGCDAIWLDLEHGGISLTEAGRWCRLITSLGMLPVVRVPEISKYYVQTVLDAGCEVLVAPNVITATEARELVRLAKYPPAGERGVSSSTARTGYALAGDVEATLRAVDAATHLMVQIESDQGLANLDEMLEVEGIDMVTVGPLDWSITLGLFGSRAQTELRDKIEKVFTDAAGAGKTTAMVVRNQDEARRYVELGVLIIFVGADVGMKRQAFVDAIQRIAGTGSAGA
jgi:4-hydroxy-2-oxoheptanedioate aldolase